MPDELQLGEGTGGGGAECAEWRGGEGARGAEDGAGEHVCGQVVVVVVVRFAVVVDGLVLSG